jgi:hypothetical protein
VKDAGSARFDQAGADCRTMCAGEFDQPLRARTAGNLSQIGQLRQRQMLDEPVARDAAFRNTIRRTS